MSVGVVGVAVLVCVALCVGGRCGGGGTGEGCKVKGCGVRRVKRCGFVCGNVVVVSEMWLGVRCGFE